MSLRDRILNTLSEDGTLDREDLEYLLDHRPLALIADLTRRIDALKAENARLLNNPGGNRTGKYTKQSEESRLAALRMVPESGTRRRLVLDVLIRSYPTPLADEQIHNAVGGDIRSVNARRKELEEGGWVVKSDVKWHAPSGNDVSTWTLSSTAVDYWGSR